MHTGSACSIRYTHAANVNLEMIQKESMILMETYYLKST